LTHYRFFFSSEWFTATDLFDERTGKVFELALTIDRVTKGELVSTGGKKGTKPTIWFRETKPQNGPGRPESYKPLACGAEMCSAIIQVTGSTEIEDWVGHQVTLFVGKAKRVGTNQEGPAVRIRPFKPGQQRAAQGSGQQSRAAQPRQERDDRQQPAPPSGQPSGQPSAEEIALIQAAEREAARRG
jgi:hypothetical protein